MELPEGGADGAPSSPVLPLLLEAEHPWRPRLSEATFSAVARMEDQGHLLGRRGDRTLGSQASEGDTT